MSSVRIDITKRKCQAFGNCLAKAPAVFGLDASRKVEILDPNGASDEAIVAAAKSCPYRVIAVTGADGVQVFPPIRK
jgi:ferredoxin